MLAFSLHSEVHAETAVDRFLEPGFDFDAAYANARRERLGDSLEITVVPLRESIATKRCAGRPQDALDVDKLEALARIEGTPDDA